MYSKLAVATVLYHCSKKDIDNISYYYDSVARVYLFDNTEIGDTDLFEWNKKDKIQYFTKHKNMGLGYAYNEVLKRAYKEGYQWLLLLDQDSVADEKMITTIMEWINRQSKINEIGIVAPTLQYGNIVERRPRNIKEVITSGSFINIKVAYEQIGKFSEELFIEFVDFEYCLRMRKKGFKIVLVNQAILRHQVNCKNVKIKKKEIVRTTTPERLYYKVRNGLYVANISRKFDVEFSLEIIRRIMKFTRNELFYEKNKVEYIKAITRAILDYHRKKMGEYS